MLISGVDLVEIDRIQQSIDRFGARFLKRIFTRGELEYCNGRPEALAARYAAKEATAKALGTGIGKIAFLDIEVVSNEDRRPNLVLHREAVKRVEELGVSSLSLSISHERKLAIAFVVGQ
jgi:holo-[acyl-carrier protein] synthase